MNYSEFFGIQFLLKKRQRIELCDPMLACKLHTVMQEAIIKMCSCHCLLTLKVIELLLGVSSLADNFLWYGIMCYPVYKTSETP